MSKRKSPPPLQPPTEPDYEILAEGNPPRPVKKRKTDSIVIDPTPPRKSPPKRGPKTEAGKERSSQNALKHGLRQDIRHFRVLRTEDQNVFEESLNTLLKELQPWDSTTQDLVHTMALTRWHLHRAEFYFESDLDRAGEGTGPLPVKHLRRTVATATARNRQSAPSPSREIGVGKSVSETSKPDSPAARCQLGSANVTRPTQT